MPKPTKNLVLQIRGLLDRLVASRQRSNDDQEVICEEVAAQARALPREEVLQTLDEAIGSNKKRRDEAVYILSELTDVPEAVERIGVWLQDSDSVSRSWLIQVVERKRLRQYAHLLTEIIENDPDPFCRDAAIHAAGTLGSLENLPVLLRLAEENGHELIWSLAWALKDYAKEECKPHLERWFEDKSREKSTRVVAAWGLGKLGNRKAIRFLVEMLHDPDEEGPNFHTSGESTRAAQALCDIYDWPFEWNKSSVAKTVALVKKSGNMP